MVGKNGPIRRILVRASMFDFACEELSDKSNVPYRVRGSSDSPPKAKPEGILALHGVSEWKLMRQRRHRLPPPPPPAPSLTLPLQAPSEFHETPKESKKVEEQTPKVNFEVDFWV